MTILMRGVYGAISRHSRLACPACHVPSEWGGTENPAH